jgi:chaperone required for assembly of F1-ATPase
LVEIAVTSPKKINRFYKEVSLKQEDEGWHLLLDGRAAKTPARNPLCAAPKALAEKITTEWHGQGEEIDFLQMPLTRLLMTVLDGKEETITVWRETPARFIGTDLLTYRAENPEALQALEDEVWNPYCDWAAKGLGIELARTTSLMALPPLQTSLASVNEITAKLDPAEALILALACEMTGSAVLGFALLEGFTSAEEVFAASHLGETFQEKRWGEDAEALQRRASQLAEFKNLQLYLGLLSSRDN